MFNFFSLDLEMKLMHLENKTKESNIFFKLSTLISTSKGIHTKEVNTFPNDVFVANLFALGITQISFLFKY